MCMECRQSPCDCRCPNAEPPEEIYICAECGLGIYEGEELIEIDGDYYHADCVEDMGFSRLLEILDLKKQIARVS